MKILAKKLIGAAMGAGVLALSSVGASAAIVCQGNVCWHTHEAYDFPHEAGIVVHEDNWHWGPREKFTFREHEGRGYWRGGKWVTWYFRVTSRMTGGRHLASSLFHSPACRVQARLLSRRRTNRSGRRLFHL